MAERFYVELIPQSRELAHEAELAGKEAEAAAVRAVIDELLQRPEHEWYQSQKELVAAAPENTARD